MKKPKRTPLERAIAAKEQAIKRLQREISEENAEHAKVVGQLQERIKVKEFLLKGLKDGSLPVFIKA